MLNTRSSESLAVSDRETDISESPRKEERGGPTAHDSANHTPAKPTACRFLRPADYSKWDELVDRSPHGTVFHYSWWLQTTASGLQILAIPSEDGTLLAGIPLPFQRRLGLTLLHSPALTPYLGPVFDLTSATRVCDRLSIMRNQGESLARSLPAFDSFRYIAGAVAPDLQGFLWGGFQVKLAYSFRFPAGHSLDKITAGMKRTHLQNITKASRLKLKVIRDEGIEDLIFLHSKTFEKKEGTRACPSDFLRRLWNEAHSRERAHLYIARTRDDRPAAGLLVVHDNRTSYQIVSGVNPECRNIPGAYAVLWNALQDSLRAGRDFDFEGSALRGVEYFYRRWGAAAMPVWRMEKAGSWRGALLQSFLNRRLLASQNKLAA